MNRLLGALALTAALSTPALARGEAGPYHHRYVQPTSEQHQKQSKAGYSQTNDPYWKPCHFTSAGYNSCD
jgi:hypothetical protein